MDLLLLLALLYLWECLASLPSNTVVFRGGPRRARAQHGGGLRLLHPWPSAACWVTGWFPLRAGAEVICTAVERTGGGMGAGAGQIRCRALAEAERIETAGPVLEIDGRPWVRTPSVAHADHLRRFCLKLAAAGSQARIQRWRAELRRSWSGSALRRELLRAQRTTFWLALLCDVNVALVFGAAPLAIVLIDEDTALLALAPALGLLHLAAVAALYATGRAHPGLRDAVGWERLLLALLYPPSLWRAPQELRSAALARFQPLTLAALLMGRDEFARFAGRRWAILDSGRAWCDSEEGATDLELERRALARMTRARGLDWEALTRAPSRDPDAAAYCPVCGAAYVSRVEVCRECRVPTRVWGGRSEGGRHAPGGGTEGGRLAPASPALTAAP